MCLQARSLRTLAGKRKAPEVAAAAETSQPPASQQPAPANQVPDSLAAPSQPAVGDDNTFALVSTADDTAGDMEGGPMTKAKRRKGRKQRKTFLQHVHHL